MQVEGMRRAGSTAQRDQYPVWPLRSGERGTEAGAYCPVGGGAAPLVVPPRLGSEITQRGGGCTGEGPRAVGGVTAQSVLLSHL